MSGQFTGGVEPEVLARARLRVRGSVPVPVTAPLPPGLARASDGERVWPLPSWPDGATPALLEEYEIAPAPLDRAGQARRVLAAALRCCWTRLDDAPWPGGTAAVSAVLEVYGGMSRGDPELARRWATGELRRLADTGWLLLDEQAGTVRPGPRVALWRDESLASLRDLLRRLPRPPADAKEDTEPTGPEPHHADQEGAESANAAAEHVEPKSDDAGNGNAETGDAKTGDAKTGDVGGTGPEGAAG